MARRREFIRAAGGSVFVGIGVAGCTDANNGDNGNGSYRFLISPDAEKSDYEPIGEYLSQELDRDVTVDRSSSTVNQVHDIRDRRAEFGETTPEVATKAITKPKNEGNDLDIVLNRRRAAGWSHASIFLTRKGHPHVEKLADLCQSGGETWLPKIGFGSRYSAPASIYPLKILHDHDEGCIGNLPKNSKNAEIIPEYHNSDRTGKKAAKKLLEDEALDAAGMALFAFKNLKNSLKRKAHELARIGGTEAKLPEIPNSPVVVHPGLDSEDKTAFVTAYINSVEYAIEQSGSENRRFKAAKRITGPVYKKTIEATLNALNEDYSFNTVAYDELPDVISGDDDDDDSGGCTTPTTDFPVGDGNTSGETPGITETDPDCVTQNNVTK